jgi:hypothetical protein
VNVVEDDQIPSQPHRSAQPVSKPNHQQDRIKVPSEFAEFIDPDLLAEGYVVPPNVPANQHQVHFEENPVYYEDVDNEEQQVAQQMPVQVQQPAQPQPQQQVPRQSERVASRRTARGDSLSRLG